MVLSLHRVTNAKAPQPLQYPKRAPLWFPFIWTRRDEALLCAFFPKELYNDHRFSVCFCLENRVLKIAFDQNGAYLKAPKGRPVILSGGFGSEVEKRLPKGASGIVKGSKDCPPIDTPDIVKDVHRFYALAGAHILTADSFNASVSRQGGDVALAKKFAVAGARLAKEVSLESGLNPLVAMSLTASGDCYSPDDTPSDDILIAEHTENINILRECGDLIFAETLPTLREARIIADLAQEAKKPFSIAFTVSNGGKTRDGYHMNDAVEAILSRHSYCFGLGVNCCTVQGAKIATRDLKQAFGNDIRFKNKHIFAYPNGGKEEYCSNAEQDNYAPEEFSVELQGLLKDGATAIGGCCGTTPEHVKKYSQLSLPVAVFG